MAVAAICWNCCVSDPHSCIGSTMAEAAGASSCPFPALAARPLAGAAGGGSGSGAGLTEAGAGVGVGTGAGVGAEAVGEAADRHGIFVIGIDLA